MPRIGHRAFLAVLLAAVMLGSACTYLVVWIDRTSQCRASREPDAYLAYCGQPKYGDYEHGAFYLNLEPGLARHLRRAEVVVVGSSQAQYGFSTQATRHYFTQAGATHYLMGFGYNEGSLFPAEIVDALRLSPKVLIISTDRFPAAYLSPPAEALIQGGLRVRIDHVAKHVASRGRRIVCDLVGLACVGRFASLFRSLVDGHWIYAQNDALPDIPIDLAKRVTVPVETFGVRVAAARELVRRVGVDHRCVVVTAAPNGQTDWDPLARAIGLELESLVVLPQLDRLATLDAIHLTRASAERWSAAVLAEIGPVLDRCLR